MTDWDGRGLPPVAQRRIDRAAASSVRSSLLSVNGQAALAHFGFQPVGEVMGCAVVQLGFQGYQGCGWGYNAFGQYVGYGGGAMQTATRRSGAFFGLRPYLDAVDGSWATALGRMSAEAQALGADGIVDIRITESRLDLGREFLVLGTAVRSIGSTHISRPFMTTLSGTDTTKLLSAGSTPITVIIATAAGIRHDDWSTVQATSMWAGNTEVPGYSDLVHATRADCRDEFRARARSVGADGSIVAGPMAIEFHEIEVGEGHRDHVGTALLVGTAIANFRSERVLDSPIGMLPLNN